MDHSISAGQSFIVKTLIRPWKSDLSIPCTFVKTTSSTCIHDINLRHRHRQCRLGLELARLTPALPQQVEDGWTQHVERGKMSDCPNGGKNNNITTCGMLLLYRQSMANHDKASTRPSSGVAAAKSWPRLRRSVQRVWNMPRQSCFCTPTIWNLNYYRIFGCSCCFDQFLRHFARARKSNLRYSQMAQLQRGRSSRRCSGYNSFCNTMISRLCCVSTIGVCIFSCCTMVLFLATMRKCCRSALNNTKSWPCTRFLINEILWSRRPVYASTFRVSGNAFLLPITSFSHSN